MSGYYTIYVLFGMSSWVCQGKLGPYLSILCLSIEYSIEILNKKIMKTNVLSGFRTHHLSVRAIYDRGIRPPSQFHDDDDDDDE
jgi:hypothetical protein